MSDFFKRFQFLRARKLGFYDSLRTALEVTILVWKAEKKVRREQENNIFKTTI